MMDLSSDADLQGITLMEFEDKMLTCRDCNKQFVFSAGEQEFFSAKGLVNEPKRCPNCRLLMRIQRNGEDVNRVAEVSCAECGVPTRVPFQPKGYRPVYCAYCFQTKKRETQSDTETTATPGGEQVEDVVTAT
jgi:CxxC-x17-CxxC domain-containing protein